MATTFEFRRHSIKDGPTSAAIGPKGYAFARAVGAAQLRGRAFNAFFTSGFWRTQQTLAAYAEGAGDFRIKFTPQSPPIYVERSDVWELWRICREAEIRGEDMMTAALAHDGGLVHHLASEVAALFRTWAATFDGVTHALVVGHSPHMEILAFGLSGTVLPGLKECEGIRIAFDGGAATVTHGSPDLDPSAIRRSLFP